MATIAALLFVASWAPSGADTPAKVPTLASGVLRVGTYFVNH